MIIGAFVSLTVITWELVEIFPQSSEAVNILVTVFSCLHLPGDSVTVTLTVTLWSQLSLAVGKSEGNGWSHSIVTFAGIFANTGALVSFTVNFCVAVAEFPQLSVAMNVLMKDLPEAQSPVT